MKTKKKITEIAANGIKYNFTFYLFILLIVLTPLSFWRGFNNSFDLVKAAIIYTAGGIFIMYYSFAVLKTGLNATGFNNILIDKKLDILLLIFLFSALISTIFSKNPYISIFGTYDRQIGLLLIIFLFIIYFLASSIIKNKKQEEVILKTLEVTGIIIALVSIGEFFGFDPLNLKPDNFSRPFSPAGHPTFSAGLMTIIFPFALLNVNKKMNVSLRALSPVIIASGILVTLTRASYAAIALQVFLAIIFYPVILKPGKYNYKKTFGILLMFFSAVLLFILLFSFVSPENIFIKRIKSVSTINSQPRWYLWQDSFEMFKHNYLTGTGPGRFSNEFENYAGYSLKLSEVKGIFDNAHNNTINILCTMGIAGGISYLLILVYVIYTLVRRVLNQNNNKEKLLLNLSLLCSFSGYLVFGIADFDDITILLHLFVLFKIFKAGNAVQYFKIPDRPFKVSAILLILVSVYGIYTGINLISAEQYYSSAIKKYKAGYFNDFVSEIKKAINTIPGQSFYRYNYANVLIEHSLSKTNLNPLQKNNMLDEAKHEVELSRENMDSDLLCLSLISLIELYRGNEQESIRLKKEIYRTDTCQFAYRNNLAGYYLNNNRDSLALNEINIVLKYDPKNPVYLKTYVIYLIKQKKYADAYNYCNSILEIENKNQFAKNTIEQLMPYLKK